MDVAVGAPLWMLGRIFDRMLEAKVAEENVKALSAELLLVKATLEMASCKQLDSPSTAEMLQKLRDSSQKAEYLLDELYYFLIHNELHGTYAAAHKHGDGSLHNLALNARRTTKAVGKKLACVPVCCSAGNPGETGEAEDANSSSEVSGCLRKLGKLLPCSSSLHPHVGDDDRGNAHETPKLEFNRVDFSRRMKDTTEQLQLMRYDVDNILIHCGPITALGIVQSRPKTTAQSMEPKLYGRDLIMNSIIHDIIRGQYCDNGLTVLPVFGLGGIGKTTLIQHIYHNEEVNNHFPVKIWICVLVNFSLDMVLEQIKRCTPQVETEKECITTEELIEQRLTSKRFLLVLDDIWQFTDVDDWKKLLLILGKSQENGSMILVTTRHKKIADQVKKTEEPKELNGLEPGEFKKLFLLYVFDAEQYPEDKRHLLHIGDKIMEKLKGSPLAAKTVGRLLRTDPSMGHWRRVLNSKEWETVNNGIMSALKLSYDFLPFNLQRCFFYSALFPEDYRFRSKELINLWIGLDILIPSGQNQTLEDIGLSNLNELVLHGFFREEETDGDLWYVMHDLLHDLALNVASRDCLCLCLPNVGSVEIHPSICHLSIIIDDVSGENFQIELELRKLKTTLKVEQLQTFMFFGQIDESFASIFAGLFRETNALRVLHLPNILCPVESMLHNFSGLVHIRYLCLGTDDREMHLPLIISRFYNLRILDIESWDGSRDLPADMSNLAKLCHFYTRYDELDISNVGKLELLEELKVFRVNKESEGFEPKQLKKLTKLRELGMYNLENIQINKEAAQAKLTKKNCLKKLTLDWDSARPSVEPGAEAVVLESLQPHRDLQELCIRGHSAPSCPTWLGDKLAVEDLQSLCLVGVSWKVLPSVGKMWNLRKLVLKHIATVKEFVIERSYCRLIWFEIVGLENFEKWVPSGDTEHMFPLLQVLIIRDCPKLLEFPFSNHIDYRPDQDIDWFPRLQELQIQYCPELSLVPPMPLTETLCYVSIRGVKLLEMLLYSNSSHGVTLDIVGNDYLHNLDQVLAFNNLTQLEKLSLVKCPPLELKQLVMLTSLKTLIAESSDALVEQLGGQGDIECLPAPPVGAFSTYEEGIIGIEHARDEFAQILCKGGNQLKILSVVGFGGLGKTTLAKAVYDKLNMQFDCRAFVPVSQNPDMQKVFMHILCELHKQNYLDDTPKDEDQLIDEIKNFLRTKRYLIVIDDLWDAKSWDIISSSLPSNDCTSRVIITTRVNKIAEKCCFKNKDLIYNVMPLGYENSKQLFLKKCFDSEDSCRDALAEVDEILKTCGGIPSAIISMASAIFPFSAGKVKEQYQEIMKSLHSATRELHYLEEFTRILSCRYLDLPKTLRDCLLYLAASAKNQRIQRDNLVRKWIAEGLIPKDKGCSPEEVAGRYFDELINRNMIQSMKYVHCLGKETYEVTYMMLYVLRLLSRKENFATFLSGSEPHVEVRPTRLFIQCSDSELPISTDRVNLTNVHSVTMLGPANSVPFKHLKNVQLLDLDGCKDLDNSAMDDICLMIKLKYLSLKQTQVTTLPPRIGKLQNLETLDVSRTQISNLPPEIRKLQNLETLDVRQTQVKELPKEVLQLPKLTHLHFGQIGSFGVKLHVGSDQLKSVKVMGTVDSRECSESAMKEISELMEVRELEVVLYDGRDDVERNDKLLSFVGKCRNLKSLTIYGDSNPSNKPLPESPDFPQLERLMVAGRFVKVPGWIAQLNTLTLLVIKVRKLEENDLVIIGGLPYLCVLELALVVLPRKQVTITSSAGFARLEVFCFDCRVPWISFEEKSMPNLKHLKLTLYSGPGHIVPSGILLLERLNMVILLYSSQYAASAGVTKIVAGMRGDAASHANLIELSVNGNREIFTPNKSADRGASGAEFDTSVNTGSEIVEVVASE